MENHALLSFFAQRDASQRSSTSVRVDDLRDATEPSTPPHEQVPGPTSDASDRRRAKYALWLVDSIAIAVATLAAVSDDRFFAGARSSILWSVGFGVVVFVALRRLWGDGRGRLRVSVLDEMARVVAVTATTAAMVIAVRVVLMAEVDIGAQTVRQWAFVTCYLVVGRVGCSVGRRGRPRVAGVNTLIVGSGRVGTTLARRLSERPELGLTAVGFVDHPEYPGPVADDGFLPLLGTTAELEQVVARHAIGHVVIAFSSAPDAALVGLLGRCRRVGVSVSLVPRMYEEITSRIQVEHLGGIALIQVGQADPRGWMFSVKYAIDRLVAGLALLVLAPLMLSLALAVRLSSPGPVFFRQRRVGLDGERFDMLKFRSMEVTADPGSEHPSAEYMAWSDIGPSAAMDRLTPVGRWLRRYSLDELPQFINVVRGDMSLIGPRPERPELVESFEDQVYRYGDRHRVKSGLTGWAQVNGLRGSSSLADRIEWDNFYIENWSPWLDLKILVLTMPALLLGRNAG